MKTLWLLALLPLALNAQERVAQDPHDSARTAHESMLGGGSKTGAAKIAGCVATTQSSSTEPCAIACQIRVPTVSLTTADSCAARTWACEWPKQAVATSAACPPGWSGSIGLDKIYEVQNCGTKLQDTGKTSTTTVNCTRIQTETSTTTCPLNNDWTGTGITYTRPVNEALGLDLATITSSTSAPWTLANIDCTRTVNKEDYATCPGANYLCSITKTQNGNKELTNTCPGQTKPAGGNVSITAIIQKLSTDLTTAQTTTSGAASATQVACLACQGDGTQYYSTPGTYSFKVPTYGHLTVELWGGGGASGGIAYPGTAGGASVFNGSVVAGGGQPSPISAAGYLVTFSSGGGGGSASGGTVNINGNPGSGASEGISGAGGSAPYGGAGGAARPSDDSITNASWAATAHQQVTGGSPGGGGSGCSRTQVAGTGGGGSGAYSKRVYGPTELTPNSIVNVTVGNGGVGGLTTPWHIAGSPYDWYSPGEAGSSGAPGAVRITWTCN